MSVLLIVDGKTPAASAAVLECYRETTKRLRDRLKMRLLGINMFMVSDELHIEFKPRSFNLNPRWYYESFAKTELAKLNIPLHDLKLEVIYE